ncbi:MAG: hypothetical protein IT429_05055 [Gemmataceae bacterium]|nr:hypothetical protein [Gemmataceae bacterium]
MVSLSLDHVEELLLQAHTPAELFARTCYEDLVNATHPTRYPGDRRAAELFARVQALHDRFRRVPELYRQLTDPPVLVPGRQNTYTLLRLLAAGDAADVHLATAAYDPTTEAEPYYLLKVSRVPEGHDLLERERAALTGLLAEAGDTTYRQYLPALVESFPIRDRVRKRVNVFAYEPGLWTLEQIHDRQPVLDPRHLGWIFRRLLTILGFSHRLKTVHGAILPCHVLLAPVTHGLRLVGWGHSGRTGQPLQTISVRYRAWYPPEVLHKRPASAAADLFLAARCLAYLAGAEPDCATLPDAIPATLRPLLNDCLRDETHLRPGDAWALLDEFDARLRRAGEAPTFHPLILT